MHRIVKGAIKATVTLCSAGCLLTSGCGGDSNTVERAGMVYAMTNAAAGNEVVAFRRNADGTLTRVTSYATGGNGTGPAEVSPATPQDGIDPLASQGSLAFSRDGRYLFAVNAGSGSVSSFRVANDGTLTRADVQASGGLQPNSLDAFGSVLYVSNVGSAANGFDSNVTGLRIESDGSLSPIAGATYNLSTNTAQPSRVIFHPSGTLLVVSELTTNKVTAFPVNADGTLGAAVVNNSSGPAPFGSYFLSTGRILVTEARPGTTGALSSYGVSASGNLNPISASVNSTQMATCWVVASLDETNAFTSNTASSSVSRYTVNADGSVTLADATASTVEGAGSGPIDSGVSSDGRNFYVLNGGKGSITAHRISSNGTLTRIGVVTGLPILGAQGLVAR